MTPSETTAAPTVVLSDVVKVYRSAGEETVALRGIDVELRPGGFVVLAGPSGSGKSSLLRLVAGHDRPTAGEVVVLGTDLAAASAGRIRRLHRESVGFVTQRPAHSLLPHLTAAQHVRQASAWRGVRVDGADVLAAVGLGGRADHRPGQLSGGEQQRLAVALATCGRPRLVVADEPTAHLDAHHADAVMAELGAAAADGSTVVVSSHDPRVIAQGARVLSLRDGVLSSEARQAPAGVVAAGVLDSRGRLQLPEELLDRFPGRRVLIEPTEDGVRLRPLEDPS